ncbi:mitochondrial ubiquitin ligase activator of NFBK 1-like protein, partial [Trifolium pratense]
VGRNVDILKSVTRVKQLKELAQLLDTRNSPLLVAISGKVAADSTIICELSGLASVIVEDTVEQHFLKHEKWDWKDHSPVTSFVSKEEFGFKRIERTLPINTSLTVIGEVSKDDAGTIRIQKPQSGPFYVSPNTIDDLIIANHGDFVRWCKYASIGFSIFGSCIIAMHTIQYILTWRRQCEMHKRVLKAAAIIKMSEQQPAIRVQSANIEGKMDDDFSDLCVICIAQKYNVAFVP